VLLCVLVAALAFAATAAAALGDPAPLALASSAEWPDYEGGQFPTIYGPTDRDEGSWEVKKGPRQTLVQVSPTEVGLEYEDGSVGVTVTAEEAWDANAVQVPTTVEITGPETVRFLVHDREGTYAYPITAGVRPVHGESIFIGSLTEPHPPAAETPAPPTCAVPTLAGLSRRAAAAKLRAADCSLGAVHLAKGTGPAKGKVVRQFRAAGTALAAGAPVAIKLGR
jgi:hypothetical protein